VNNLISLCRRLGYNCPIEHVSDIFFTLYELNKPKADLIEEIQIQVGMTILNKEPLDLSKFELKPLQIGHDDIKDKDSIKRFKDYYEKNFISAFVNPTAPAE